HWGSSAAMGQSYPTLFRPKEKVNTKVYLNVLKTVVVLWMDSVASGTLCTFQQDSAPVHKAKLVQSWLKNNVPNFWDSNTWPPNSPGLKLMRLPLVCATYHSNVASLMASIKSEMNNWILWRPPRLWEVQASFGDILRLRAAIL
ncbi:Transposable element tcb2 transposase, partial [Caligus rogercresseyi]